MGGEGMLFRGGSGLWCGLGFLGANIGRRQSSRGHSYTHHLRHRAATSCELSFTFLLIVSMTLPSLQREAEAPGDAAYCASSSCYTANGDYSLILPPQHPQSCLFNLPWGIRGK